MSPVRYISQLTRRMRRRELMALGALLLIVVGVWTFIAIADEVVEGESQKFDERIVQMFRQSDDPARHVGPHWLAEAARDMTALGSAVVLVTVIFVVCGALALMKKYHAMWLVFIASNSGQMLSQILKWVFARDRPTVVPHFTEVTTSSFPSGHAMSSAVVYLTLAAILMRLTPKWRLKLYILSIGLFLTFLIGMTRIFLGVHYPTDVLSGWAAGLVWALLCWVVALYLQKTGAVESENQGDLSGHESEVIENA